ncbi:hypothetical protein C8J55DRAFT_286756 [Lentinula edodes]|uniref:Uncharacterized protein n=1 Tax=Lentinula lateritia TaxID=40482 RepID=A0A9W8ZQM4_9AGAR|nr:hypothetical protein C8J55DRAFT_286756 [Lentinula edodes]
MLEAGVQALYDDAAALWGHVQVLRVEGSDYPYSHSSSSSSNINSSSEFLSSSSYHSSDVSFSNQTDPAMILSVVNVLSTAIKANAAVVLQILDKLLALGVEQRTIVEGVLEEEDSATSSVGVAGGDMMNTRGTNGVRRWEESVRWSKRVSRDVDRDVSKRMSHQRSSMVKVRPASILPASVGPGAQGGGGYGGGAPTALQPGYNMLRYGGYEGQTHEVYDEYGRGSSSLPVSQMVGGGVTAPGIVGSDGDDELGLEDAFLRPQRPIRLEPIRFQGPQSPDAYGVPASQIIQGGQGKLQASGSSA